MNTDVAKIKKETQDMMTQIMNINKSIDHSKYMVGGLKDKEHSWLAKLTGKAKDEKIADLAVALGSTNVAVADLSKVVQKAMILSQHSVIHSQTMADTISNMLRVGLQDANGRIVQLSDQDREIAKYILKSAESFTKNQKEIATEFSKTSDQVGSLEDRIEKIQREQNEFISAQQKKTEDLQNTLYAKSSRLEDKVDTSIKELETKVDSKVKKCENLINNFKGELNSQRDNLESIVADAGKNLRQETEKLLQQQQVELEELKKKVKNSISIKEVDNKIANQIGGLAAHIGEIQEKQEYQQKIRLALKKVFDIKYNNLENKVKESEKKIADEVKLRQETEKRLQQQQVELEELKSQIIYNDLENKVEESEKKIADEVKRCENLIKTYKDELENQRVESKQELDNFTQQLDNKVENSIKEVTTIVTDAGKNLRQETEKLLLQQKAELEELKSQLQAKRKIQPLSIVTLIVSIAALLVAIITFCTGNPATDIEAPTSTTMEIETTTEVPAAQQ